MRWAGSLGLALTLRWAETLLLLSRAQSLWLALALRWAEKLACCEAASRGVYSRRANHRISPAQVISPDFSLELTRFFPGKHLIHFLVLEMKDFRNFVQRCFIHPASPIGATKQVQLTP